MKKSITLIIAFILFIGNFNIINAQTVDNTDEEATTSQTYYSKWSENFPSIDSNAGIVMDAETGSILYGKNIDENFFPASITKVLTTLIALENSTMNETVVFSHEAVFDVDLNSSRIGIDVGEELTMEQCLYGIMLASANEVSHAVAEHIAGDISSFSELMNNRAKELGATNSNFLNPHGLPDPNHYTTAHDMAVISRAAIQNEEFRKITSTRTYNIPPTNIQEETRYLANHHKFIKGDLNYDCAIGGKTGWTSISRHTLVTFAEKNGMTLISVVMDCPNRSSQYSDTATLLDYAFESFKSYNIDNSNPYDSGIDFFTKYPSFFNLSNSPLRISENGKIILPSSINIDDTNRQVQLKPIISLIDGYNNIGSIVYSYEDNKLGETNIIFSNTESDNLFNNLYINSPDVEVEELNENLDSNIVEEVNDNSHLPIVIGVAVGLIFIALSLLILYFFYTRGRKRRRNNF